MLKIAVIISGGGSNLQALIDACETEDYPADITTVISNRPDAFGLKRAEKAGLPTSVIDHKDYPDRESFDAALHQAIVKSGADFVCLAGFMRILTDAFIQSWHDRMLNIHPSLLPKHKGLHTHKQALEDGVPYHGATVHFVRPELDHGPLILQARVPVMPGDTPDSLAARVLSKEHVIYPLALKMVAEGQVACEGDDAKIAGQTGPLMLENLQPDHHPI